MWRCIVQPDRPQMTIWRMRNEVGYLRLQTHTHNTYYLLLFHYNNGCKNASQCYVVRTLPVFLSHKVVKLARVWQLKIVPAAGENSIVTGSEKWGLLFDFFAQSNHDRHDCLQCTVREQSLLLIVRSNETGNEHKTVVYRRVMELLGRQPSSSGWFQHRDIPFLRLVREGPAAGIGQSTSALASASFGDIWG